MILRLFAFRLVEKSERNWNRKFLGLRNDLLFKSYYKRYSPNFSIYLVC